LRQQVAAALGRILRCLAAGMYQRGRPDMQHPIDAFLYGPWAGRVCRHGLSLRLDFNASLALAVMLFDVFRHHVIVSEKVFFPTLIARVAPIKIEADRTKNRTHPIFIPNPDIPIGLVDSSLRVFACLQPGLANGFDALGQAIKISAVKLRE
jgi:hypothetical protein